MLFEASLCYARSGSKEEKIKISGLFTCDNAYQVWVGDQAGVIKKLIQGMNWYGYSYVLPADRLRTKYIDKNKYDFVYVVAWSDDDGYQGFIGSFTGDFTIHSGDKRWQVLPSGINKKWPRKPGKGEINRAIRKASPEDWKKVFVGAPNGGLPWQHKFRGISKSARWMWYDSGIDKRDKYPNAPYVPFKGANHNEFLIFRCKIPDFGFAYRNGVDFIQ